NVNYENTEYAVEVQSTTLEELQKQLCKEFAWNNEDFQSMNIVHESRVIASLPYYQSILRQCWELKKPVVLVLSARVVHSKPLQSKTTSTPVIEPTSSNSYAQDSFHVMLSYDGKELILAIKKRLESHGLRVWFDEEEMRANMYERMAEAITKSLVITPLLTVGYSRSANCKRELSYAADLKKHIEPTRALNPNEQLEKWAELITAGMIYYDFSNALTDTDKFNSSFESLYKAIRHGISKKADQPQQLDTVEPVDPLTKWLRPVDFSNDLAKFRNDYVKGTRKWAVHNVHRWLQDGLNSFLWLNGGAGLGKSIIAYLVSQNLPFGFDLSSVFFCKHDDVNKNNAGRIISTIAFNLSSKLPEYHEFLMKKLEEDAAKVAEGEISILSKPSVVFKELIIEGLQKIEPPSSHLVIIIDALDEVGKQGEPVRDEFLRLIRIQVEQLPNWIRVFTTSRPEMDIFNALNGVNFAVLSPQDQNNIQDIQLFIQHQLSTHLSVNEGRSNDLRLRELVMSVTEKTGGVFHYARLACNTLTETSHSSWDEVVEMAKMFDGGLDHIYLQVLERAFDGADEMVFDRFQLVMSVVLTAREPLHQDSIARLSGLTIVEVASIILRVQAILTITSGIVKVLHKSLKDFLCSLERCKNRHFFIDTNTFESIMATSCLNVLIADLTRNMANLPNDVDPVPASTAACITPCLAYACRFWDSHVVASQNSRVLEHLFQFCSKSLLLWIEAMVLLKTFSNELGAQLRHVANWVSNFGEESATAADAMDRSLNTRDLLEDAARLIWRFYTQITHNPLQIYTVAIAFSPQGTQIFRTFNADRLDATSTSIIGQPHWGAHLQYFYGHTADVDSVCFSNDGTQLLSASADTTVRVWDVLTGKELLMLEGHTAGVRFARFSRNNRMIASFSNDNVFIFWDRQSGSMVKKLRLLQYEGSQFALSWDFSLLAIEGDSETIHIFEITGAVDCLGGHTAQEPSRSLIHGLTLRGYAANRLVRNCLSFSPSGQYLAAGDCSQIKIWDTQSGHELATFDNSQPHWITQLQFSFDETLLVSGDFRGYVQDWGFETEAEVVKYLGHKTNVNYVCISEGGSVILSGCGSEYDKSLIIWDMKSRKQLGKLWNNSPTSCCALSPDSTLASSGGKGDSRISLWDLNSISNLSHKPSHTNTITCLKISPDGKQAASCTYDKTMIIWDIQSGTAVKSFDFAEGSAFDLQWSDNGEWLILGCYGGSVSAWNVSKELCEEIKLHQAEPGKVNSVLFSKDGLLAASGRVQGDKMHLTVWNVVNGTVLSATTLPCYDSEICRPFFFTHDSNVLVIGGCDTVWSWDVGSGKVYSPLQCSAGKIVSMCTSSNDRLI
ncbi:WD repeat-containing protein 20, partial [Blyttiomyces sp. JEL0837]